ncbi:MAG: DUF1194 domain-containing protein [Hyphomicrobiales bacterium]
MTLSARVRPLWLMANMLALFLAVFAFLASAKGNELVDLELVLAVDISLSMDKDEQRLQRQGYVSAFRDPGIHAAIQSGPHGSIAVTYVEWAGSGSQSVIVPWRIIKSSEDAHAFADALAAEPAVRALYTSISEAVLASSRLISISPVKGLRRVIDVSGDGPNNSGIAIEVARDRVVSSGIVINGLAIELGQGGGAYSYFDLPDLDRYYKDCVIGGPGSFVLSIRNKNEFAAAIRKKLLLEIANTPPPETGRLWRAQLAGEEEKYDCLIGEKLWRQYQMDYGDE